MSDKTGFIARLDGPLEFITSQLKQGWLARIVLIILILASIGAIWWSINERLSLIYGATSITRQQASIERESDKLQMQWSSQNHEKIGSELEKAESKLMPDQKSMADWLGNYITKAQNQQIQLVYNVGRAQLPLKQLGNIHLVPIQIILRPSDNLRQQDAYTKILDFAKDITDNEWRMDVSSASVTGNGRRFEQLEMQIKIWMSGKVNANGEPVPNSGFSL